MKAQLGTTGRNLWVSACRPAFWRILFLGLVIGPALMAPAGTALAQEPTPPPGGGGGLGGITASLAGMAKIVVDFLVGISAILLAIGIITGFVQGQATTMFGMPHALASMWVKITGVIVCFVGAVLTIAIANAIIDAMAGFQSSEGIHLPGQGA